MLGRTAQIEVPRRAVVCQLLFTLASIVWLNFSFLFVHSSILNSRAEKEFLSYLEVATQTAVLDYLQDGEDSLQKLVSFRLACMTDFAGPSGVVSGRPGAVIT